MNIPQVCFGIGKCDEIIECPDCGLVDILNQCNYCGGYMFACIKCLRVLTDNSHDCKDDELDEVCKCKFADNVIPDELTSHPVVFQDLLHAHVKRNLLCCKAHGKPATRMDIPPNAEYVATYCDDCLLEKGRCHTFCIWHGLPIIGFAPGGISSDGEISDPICRLCK